jgi:hypothetical protein
MMVEQFELNETDVLIRMKDGRWIALRGLRVAVKIDIPRREVGPLVDGSVFDWSALTATRGLSTFNVSGEVTPGCPIVVTPIEADARRAIDREPVADSDSIVVTYRRE